MATYVLPQVRVFQEASLRPAAESNPQRACIMGGNAHLVRISEADEKPLGRLGLYDLHDDTTYPWPNKPGTSVIDSDYTKIYAEDALLRYYEDAIGAGGAINLVSGTTNRIRAASLNFATNGGYARSAAFYSRDVQAGDVIRVRGIAAAEGPGADEHTLWTYVRSVEPDVVSEVFGTPTAYASNAPTVGSASATITQTAGDANGVSFTASAAAYEGTVDGHTQETYVIRVLDSSVQNDFTTARLQVLSASGTDDVLSLVPSDGGIPTPIGTRGLTVTFDINAVVSASWTGGSSAGDLIRGQEFTVVARQAFTARSMQLGTGAAYRGRTNTTYIVEVVKGGTLASGPQIMVTTSDGSDQSGPHTITAENTNIAIGTQGVLIKFATVVLSPSRYCKGDKFYLSVTAAGSGPLKTLVLGKSLPSTFTTTDDLSIELYIRKPLLEIPERSPTSLSLRNWTQDASGVTVISGIKIQDAEVHDNGVPVNLDLCSNADLHYGTLYVEYRAWLKDLTTSINVLYDVADLDVIPGKDTYDNPLKFNTRIAIGNSNGVGVGVVAVSDPASLDSWEDAIEVTGSRDDLYGLVPLSENDEVLATVQTHVEAMSSPTKGMWRSCWVPLMPIKTIPIVHAGTTMRNYTEPTTSNGALALGSFDAASGAPGAPNTRLRVPAANADFLANGVRAGDIVRAFYGLNGFGDEVYSEFVVNTVESESVLYTLTGPASANPVPVKLEIWRPLTASEQAVEVGRVAASYGSSRVCAVWAEALAPAYTLAACSALAGLASGVMPHQALTNVTISGLSPYVKSTNALSAQQLADIAVRGGLIVSQTTDGHIISRHALTTGSYSNINEREEVIRRNLDNISYRVKDFFAPYIGVTNVTGSMQEQIRTDFSRLTTVLQTERFSLTAGPQIVSLTLDKFTTTQAFRDRYVVQVTVVLPYPLNNLDIYLVLG